MKLLEITEQHRKRNISLSCIKEPPLKNLQFGVPLTTTRVKNVDVTRPEIWMPFDNAYACTGVER